MKFIKTDIEGVMIIEPKVFHDHRGYFFESYNEEEFFNKLNEERTWSNADDFEKELTAQDPWLEDWKRSISIEDFRKNCKNKLNKLFP